MMGFILAFFSIIMITNVSAIEYNIIDKQLSTLRPNINEEELRQLIIERIDEMKEQNKKIELFGVNATDPDGPLEGGLDDLSDYYYLFLSLMPFISVLQAFRSIFQAGNILDRLSFLVSAGFSSFSTLVNLGEAFDVFDRYPSDGR